MGTSNLKVTGINHVVLHVADLDRSRTFYMEALGFDDRGISVPGMRPPSCAVACRVSTSSKWLTATSTAARR